MQSSLVSLSNELAKLVEEFQSHVVAVHARAHYPSSGVHWRPGIVVTADHTVGQEEDIQVTLPSGKRVEATLAGRDSGTDIAVLKVEGLGSSAARCRWRRRRQGGRVGAGARTLSRQRAERQPGSDQRSIRPLAHVARRTPRPIHPS